MRIWDLHRKRFLNSGWNHPQQVFALVFNRKGDRLITACGDNLARVFAVGGSEDSRVPLYPPVGHTPKSPPALIDEDRSFITQTGDSELTRWDLASGKPASPPIHTRPRLLQGVVASHDGNWFVTGGYYGPELFAVDAKKPTIHLGHTNQVTNYVFSSDDSILLSVGIDQTARLWSIAENRPTAAPIKHMANVERCAWSDDSIHFATFQNDGLIRVWRLPTDDLVIAAEPSWGQRPRLSFDGRLAVPGLWHETAMGGIDQHINRLLVVRTEDGKPACDVFALPGVLVDSCVTSNNLAVAAVWSRGSLGELGVWDLAQARAKIGPISLPGAPLAIAARPGIGQLAVICSTGDLLVFDDTTGKRLLELRHEPWASFGNFVQAQYTADGKSLVSLSAGPPPTINVRDADSGSLRFAPFSSKLAGSNFHTFTLSPDSRFVATIGLVKNAVEVWDLDAGRATFVSLAPSRRFLGLVLSAF